MPEVHTEEVSQGDLPRGFKTDVKQTVATAVALGWKLVVSGKESMTIIAPPPNDHKKYHFTKKRTSGPLQRIRKDIIKFADPMKLAVMDGVMDGVIDPRQVDPFKDAKVENLDLVDEAAMKERQDRAERRSHRQKPKTEVARALERAEANAAAKAEKEAAQQPTIVSEQPMMVRRGGTKGYPSETTIERTWSDGSVDYRCRLCDYNSKHRGGLRGHWAKHIKAGEVEAIGQASYRGRPQVQDPSLDHEPAYSRAYTPRRDRVEALAAFLTEQAGNGPLDPQIVAKAALCWVHEQSKHKTRLAAEHEALEPMDILDRIRMLLDQGEYMEQREEIAAKDQEIADLREYIIQVEDDHEKMAQKADDLEGKLRALYDLLGSELGPKDTPEVTDSDGGA